VTASSATDALPSQLPFWQRVSRTGITWVVGTLFETSARLGTRLPIAKPARHGVMVDKDIPYATSGDPAHLLDVYRPTHLEGPAPVVIYIHGGGFRILSKNTHWVMAIELARRGYVVFTINYRLAPAHPFPAAAEDACAAFRWVVEHAERFGGDPTRIAISGESAGANLATTVATTTCYRRPEPWAQATFDLGVVPTAVVPACGILQVSDPRRFERMGLSSRLTQPVIDACFANYICGHHGVDVEAWPVPDDGFGLADPLCVIEASAPDRPLPPFYIPCGTADPLIDDTRRLAEAVRKHGSAATESFFPRMGHSFHAWVVRPEARRCWTETHAFLAEHMKDRVSREGPTSPADVDPEDSRP